MNYSSLECARECPHHKADGFGCPSLSVEGYCRDGGVFVLLWAGIDTGIIFSRYPECMMLVLVRYCQAR